MDDIYSDFNGRINYTAFICNSFIEAWVDFTEACITDNWVIIMTGTNYRGHWLLFAQIHCNIPIQTTTTSSSQYAGLFEVIASIFASLSQAINTLIFVMKSPITPWVSHTRTCKSCDTLTATLTVWALRHWDNLHNSDVRSCCITKPEAAAHMGVVGLVCFTPMHT